MLRLAGALAASVVWVLEAHAANVDLDVAVVLPWTTICGLEDAKAAALVISEKGCTGFVRKGRNGTSGSPAIDIGSLLLDQFPGKAAKKVIDISGNGENNDGLPS
ncbi:DUF1194 domain-containing protein [Mesorhizobium sp.]|uniref:DUF1194 domain-containing protein n=1 Tax=Mesorhizobium sp. TaxID=1871066 RepID=UPI0025DDBC24|nr:DUF1194 domain-containing protein [Mesorhizobium sp.]